MEIIDNNNQQVKYAKAIKRVKELKKFHKHVAAYIIVNIALNGFSVVRNFNFDTDLSEILLNFNTSSLWFWWGIGLVAHAFKVYGYNFMMSKNWEDRKIKELIEKEDQRSKKFN